MTSIVFEHSNMSETFMKVIFDSNRPYNYKKREWEAFKKIIDNYLELLHKNEEVLR